MSDKRWVVGVVLTAVLAVSFWSGSRYPALNQKAQMGSEFQLADPLSFDVVFPVQPGDPVPTRVGKSTINWLQTNAKGMVFGILLAASFMSLFSLLERKSYKDRFANTLLGVVIGAPLGVCVNCAAPIARGLHAAGARVETTLAAMFSSPTFNVVVLTMLFSMFPLYMALIKFGLSLLFILVVVPVVTWWAVGEHDVENCGVDPHSRIQPGFPATDSFQPFQSDTEGPADSWTQALGWLTRHFCTHLWFILKWTLPLMLLAGFLGALVVNLLPTESLVEALPVTYVGKVLGMAGVAVVGLFLPVPIAFDVVVTAALMAAGMPVMYAMILLFTLGIFSVYPFTILWTAVSRKLIVTLVLGLLTFGVAGGAAAHEWNQFEQRKQQEFLREYFFSNFDFPAERPSTPLISSNSSDLELVDSLKRAPLDLEPMEVDSTIEVVVERTDFADHTSTPGPLFQKFEGSLLGLDANVGPSTHPLLGYFRGIASGDVHNDGWPDILITAQPGMSLYANVGGREFVRQALAVPDLRGLLIVNGALVDLNNDGWSDILFSTIGKGAYVIYNNAGSFVEGQLVQLPFDGAQASPAIAIGDVDLDGDLDVVLGHRDNAPLPTPTSQDVLIKNDPSGFNAVPLSGVIGTTMASLLTDINGDRKLDLIAGVDGYPDNYYLGDGGGRFDLIMSGDETIPHSTHSTMSIDSADIDNDLVPEFYLTQVTGRTVPRGTVLRRLAGIESCGEVEAASQENLCREYTQLYDTMVSSWNKRNVFDCLEIGSEEQREVCIVWHLSFSAAWWAKNQPLCDLFPSRWEMLAYQCNMAFLPTVSNEEEFSRAIPYIFDRNVLLMAGSDGRFNDRALEKNVSFGEYSWSGKFADLDHDGWQDLYLVNGAPMSRYLTSNFFYRNEGGERFVDETAEHGLVDYLSTGAFTFVDFDNDGDLDIIAAPFGGGVRLYRNNVDQGHAIVFELRDYIGNASGIGSKIVVHYGPDGSRHQMREIKMGGGYMSYDAPRAHFGLADFDGVQAVEVFWSTGERSVVRGDFQAGTRYRITRSQQSE